MRSAEARLQPCALFEFGKRFLEAGKRDRDSDARFLGLEDDEDCRLAALELLNERIVDHDLRVACKAVAAQERRMADVLVVDLENFWK